MHGPNGGHLPFVRVRSFRSAAVQCLIEIRYLTYQGIVSAIDILLGISLSESQIIIILEVGLMPKFH
jgi:hypothetical protein